MQADTSYPNNNKQAANIIESAKLKAASSSAALLRGSVISEDIPISLSTPW